LNFSRILLRRRGPAVRNLSIEDLREEIHRENPNVRGITKSGWRTLQRLLPQKGSVHSSEMRVQDGPTLILLRNGTFFTSEIEAGRFSAGEVMIASPWLRQTFSQLRGATRWHANPPPEPIMLGAPLYNQQIQLQQLYIKQKTNQMTLSGHASFPAKSSDWLSPDFRGDIAATINNLDDFTILFGAKSGEFAGKLFVEGALKTQARQLGGNLSVEGTSLTLFKTAIDSLSANLKLQGRELAIEQLELKRKNDSLTAEGKIEMSGAHSYSGTLDARADNLLDYLSGFRGSTGKSAKPIPVDVQATIESNKWDARGVIRVPDSSPISFTADFPLRIGTDWCAFQLSPVNVTVDFPSIFLGKMRQLFHPEVFQDGILSGSISLSETLQHPRIVGDVQLVNGKLSASSGAWFNLTEASSRIVFEGDRASLEFFNAATKEADVLVRGEIDFKDTSDITIRVTGATPIFDLTSRLIDC